MAAADPFKNAIDGAHEMLRFFDQRIGQMTEEMSSCPIERCAGLSREFDELMALRRNFIAWSSYLMALAATRPTTIH